MSDKIEEIRKALEGATPGPWNIGPDTEEGRPAMLVTAKGWDIATAWGGYNAAESDTKLIALAPNLARIVLAAEKLADSVEEYAHMQCDTDEMERACIAYRKAVEGGE